MHTMIESITPTLAKAYLEKNTNNRPLNLSHVKYLAASMSNGQWRITHESIAFDRDDKLIDGQHRLSAVVSSGATVQISVTRGCDSSTFAVINDGQRRSASDALSIAGEKNAVRLAAIVAVAIRGAETSSNKRAVSRQTVCEFLTSKHGNLAREIASHAGHATPHIPCVGSGAGLRGILSGELRPQDVMDGIDRWRNTLFTSKGDPMRALHIAYENTKGNNAKRYLYAVRAWRAVAQKTDVKSLRVAEADFNFDFSTQGK